jgi:hypothetical protein
MAVISNPVNHDRTKHIDLKWHITRHKVQEGEVQLKYLETGEQIADALTKSVPRDKLEKCSQGMGVGPPPQDTPDISPTLQIQEGITVTE